MYVLNTHGSGTCTVACLRRLVVRDAWHTAFSERLARLWRCQQCDKVSLPRLDMPVPCVNSSSPAQRQHVLRELVQQASQPGHAHTLLFRE